MHRRLGFACRERENEEIKNKFEFYEDGGYSSSVEYKLQELPNGELEDGIVINYLKDADEIKKELMEYAMEKEGMKESGGETEDADELNPLYIK